ncbi:MAG: FprA family A-type flavoprotein, partial [Limnochordia bacterium]
DYIVVNHVEMDHSGALPKIKELCPQAPIICSPRAVEPLQKHFDTTGWEFQVVKTGDSLDLGGKTLSFIEAPMLHWPDSMFTYVPEDALLLPNDAFGQHLATSQRFDDEVEESILMDEAAKYYANILLPFSTLVEKKLKELTEANLPVDMIAPSHGIIWRGDPGKILAAYQNWSTQQGTPQRVSPQVVIVYETMWESTAKMAFAMADQLADLGVRTVVYQACKTDRNDVIREILEADGVLIGSSTINNDILATLAPLLEDLVGLKPKGKLGLAFGSHGWRGGAVDTINAKMKEAGMELLGEGVKCQWVPTDEDLELCRQQARQLAEKLKVTAVS